jgi:hypothetical protein
MSSAILAVLVFCSIQNRMAYELVPDQWKGYLMIRYYDYFGHLDTEGRFVPSIMSLPNEINELGYRRVADSAERDLLLRRKRTDTPALFEFRSGRLIPGTVQKAKGSGEVFEPIFVPDLGGEIITMDAYLKTYDPEKSVPIYNLPGRIVPASERPLRQRGFAWRQDAKTLGSRQGQPSLALRAFMMNTILFAPPTESLASYKLEYRSKWNAYVVMGDYEYTGKIDEDGRFVPDPQNLPKKLEDKKRLGDNPAVALYRQAEQGGSSKTYEFRSERLIPGAIQAAREGGVTFVPDLGGKVIALETYLRNYDPKKHVPIYNLPGEIVAVKPSAKPGQ